MALCYAQRGVEEGQVRRSRKQQEKVLLQGGKAGPGDKGTRGAAAWR